MVFFIGSLLRKTRFRPSSPVLVPDIRAPSTKLPIHRGAIAVSLVLRLGEKRKQHVSVFGTDLGPSQQLQRADELYNLINRRRLHQVVAAQSLGQSHRLRLQFEKVRLWSEYPEFPPPSLHRGARFEGRGSGAGAGRPAVAPGWMSSQQMAL